MGPDKAVEAESAPIIALPNETPAENGGPAAGDAFGGD